MIKEFSQTTIKPLSYSQAIRQCPEMPVDELASLVRKYYAINIKAIEEDILTVRDPNWIQPLPHNPNGRVYPPELMERVWRDYNGP